MRLATIDIGTNTAQLLVVEIDGDTVQRRHAAERFVRLGEGVDAQGRIGSAAVDRLVATLRGHVRTARAYDVHRITAAGTSALRDAENCEEVLDTVQSECGLDVETLSGEEEATWSFAAACAPFDNLSGSCLVVDIGGGSTELVAGMDPARDRLHPENTITGWTSLDAGCVRLTERCFSAQPPSKEDVRRTDRLISDALDDLTIDFGTDPTLIGTAGTATALALVHAGPDSTWDALHGDGFVLTRTEVRQWRKRLLTLTVEEIRALHPDAMDGRADVFSVGVMLLDQIMGYVGASAVHVAPYELRHGLALRMLSSDDNLSPSPLL